jgi:hypothetical protein
MARRELAVQRRLHVCCSSSETVIVPVLKSVVRKRTMETLIETVIVPVLKSVVRKGIVETVVD